MLFDNILVSPGTNKKLVIEGNSMRLQNLNTNLFEGKMDGEIPIITPLKISNNLNKTDLHNQTNAEFDYVDHYQRDAEQHDYFAEIENPIADEENNRLHQKILSRIPKTTTTILDIGCGGGWLSSAKVSSSVQVISVDVSLVNVKKVLSKTPHKNHHGLVADVFHLPIAENSIDCIVASEIMEHVSLPNVFIKKLIKLLRKDGILIITTPFDEKIKYNLCVHCNKPTPTNAHLHSFNQENVKEIIPKNIAKSMITTFGNRVFIRLRIYYLLRKLSFGVWNWLDGLINKVIKKPTRIMIEVTK